MKKGRRTERFAGVATEGNQQRRRRREKGFIMEEVGEEARGERRGG